MSENKSGNRNFFWSGLSFILVIVVMCINSGLVIAQDSPRTAGSRHVSEQKDKEVKDKSELYRQLNLFGDVFERIKAQYVEEVEDKELIDAAINGMLSHLDPHSSYLNDDDFKEMQVQTQGKFGGLGIEVTMESGFVKVVSPIDDTPAFRAGVKAGDYITHIDGESVLGLSLNEAVSKMRGDVGDPIDITVRREGEKESLEFHIIRDIIKIRSVRSKIFDEEIGYVRITTFNQNTTSGLEEAIRKIKNEAKSADKELIGYVIDLRNNPGGLLNEAISVSDAFLDKGEIVSTRGRQEDDVIRDNARKGDLTDGLPLVVLINGGSASASEIVSGALKDHRRALIVGTKSFGKGSVQTVIPLAGHGAMRLTTARYYTPSGVSIQAKGIEPDIEIEVAKIEQFEDTRTREADLRGALDKSDDKSDDKDSDNADDEDNSREFKQNSEDIKDYQLLRAVELLRGISIYESSHGSDFGDSVSEIVKQNDESE